MLIQTLWRIDREKARKTSFLYLDRVSLTRKKESISFERWIMKRAFTEGQTREPFEDIDMSKHRYPLALPHPSCVVSPLQSLTDICIHRQDVSRMEQVIIGATSRRRGGRLFFLPTFMMVGWRDGQMWTKWRRYIIFSIFPIGPLLYLYKDTIRTRYFVPLWKVEMKGKSKNEK